MKTALVVLGALVIGLACVGAMGPQMPAGKCRHPIPDYPGLNISQVENEVFKYLYTPNVMIYKIADSITMQINKVEGEEGVYSETINAWSMFKTRLDMQFKVKHLGNGVLQKVTKEGEMSYYASIVAIEGDVAMIYVCSDEAEDFEQDFRYIIARKCVDSVTVADPEVLFKDVNEKFQFKGEFRRLPQKWLKKNF